MRKFESIIMSNTEPLETRTLWIKEKTGGVSPSGNNVSKGNSIWYFGNQGWKPLFDFDTRYIFKDKISYEPSTEITSSEQTPDNENGIVNIEKTFSMYNGDRELGNNENFVNETGLKVHVDSLQSQIDSAMTLIAGLRKDLTEHIADFDTHVSEYENHVKAYETFKASIESKVEELSSKLNTLDASVKTINTTISTIEGNITSMQSSIKSLQEKVNSLETVEP